MTNTAWHAVLLVAATLCAVACTPPRVQSTSPPHAIPPVASSPQDSTPRSPIVQPSSPNSTPASSPPVNPPASTWTNPFPHIAINLATKQLRISGFVPIDAHDPKKPNIFLEVLVCARNTKEHEALVVTDAKPVHVHAALLLLGIEPGAPGRWNWPPNATRPTATRPRGPRLRVTVQPSDAPAYAPAPLDITAWVIQVDRATRLPATDHFVFAGSRFQTIGPAEQTQEAYAADVDGTIIGLTAFGSETIAWMGMYHPDTSVESPAWIADSQALPPFGTNVHVYVTVEADK